MLKALPSALLPLALTVFISCATLPRDVERSPSYAYTDTDNTALGRYYVTIKAAYPGKTGCLVLDNGLDAFVARAILAQDAERSIDVQYYLYHDDLVGRLFTHQLVKAADRGVHVRLLVDDMDLAGRDLDVSIMDQHPNVEVRIFNPFSRKTGRTSQFVTRMGSVTRRMHNKSFNVDNQVAILGGRNIGNEYFNADPDLAFADLDVLVIGPAVNEVSTAFDRYWNSELAYPASVLLDEAPTAEEISSKRAELDAFVARQTDSPYLTALRNSDLARKIKNHQVTYSWGDAVVVYDQPEKLLHGFGETKYHLSPQLKPYWEEVKRELTIFSPYFVPGKSGTAFLTDLAKRGVRVRILTNSLSSNDVSLVHAGYSKYRIPLLQSGVELYEMNKKISSAKRKEKKGAKGSSKASLHAKSFVFDRKRVFIGSLNLDPRAVIHNTEIGVVVDALEIAEAMADWFDRNIDKIAFRLELQNAGSSNETILWHGIVDGVPKTFTEEPYSGFWKRLGIRFMSIWPIESQL